MLPRSGRRGWASVTLLLLDDEAIAAVNAVQFGRARPTDVISFAYEPLPGEPDRPSGEVLVNVERAVREGRRRRGGASRELALYITHGCLHLAGETDGTAAGRARMRRLEREVLDAAKARRLLDGLVEEPSGGRA